MSFRVLSLGRKIVPRNIPCNHTQRVTPSHFMSCLVACLKNLTQVCVACTGQVMPIWVHNTSLIALQVVSVETPHGGGTDVACVRLTADTEVAVSPKPRRRRRLPEGEENEQPPCPLPPYLYPIRIGDYRRICSYIHYRALRALSAPPMFASSARICCSARTCCG